MLDWYLKGPYNSFVFVSECYDFKNNVINSNTEHFRALKIYVIQRVDMILTPPYRHRFNINFWLTQEFSVQHQNPSVLEHEFTILSSHIVCACNPRYQIWFMKSASMVKCVNVTGEICISSFATLLKHFFTLSVSVIQTPLWQGTWRKMTVPELTMLDQVKAKVLWIFPTIADVHLKMKEAY